MKKFFQSPFTIAVLIISFWFCSPWLISKWFKWLQTCGVDYSSFGTFGDMFGTITALFSGLTIAGLVYTIYLQRKEINDTQLEIKDQKKRDANRRFEERFFNLVKVHRNIFKHIESSFEGYETNIIGKLFFHPQNPVEAVLNSYKNDQEIQHVLKNFINYLQTFEVIVKSIQTRNAKAQDKYFKIWFAQFHINERKFFLYHFNLRKEGKPKEWDIIKKYGFIGLDKSHFKMFYKFNDFKFDGLE